MYGSISSKRLKFSNFEFYSVLFCEGRELLCLMIVVFGVLGVCISVCMCICIYWSLFSWSFFIGYIGHMHLLPIGSLVICIGCIGHMHLLSVASLVICIGYIGHVYLLPVASLVICIGYIGFFCKTIIWLSFWNICNFFLFIRKISIREVNVLVRETTRQRWYFI